MTIIILVQRFIGMHCAWIFILSAKFKPLWWYGLLSPATYGHQCSLYTFFCQQFSLVPTGVIGWCLCTPLWHGFFHWCSCFLFLITGKLGYTPTYLSTCYVSAEAVRHDTSTAISLAENFISWSAEVAFGVITIVCYIIILVYICCKVNPTSLILLHGSHKLVVTIIMYIAILTCLYRTMVHVYEFHWEFTLLFTLLVPVWT